MKAIDVHAHLSTREMMGDSLGKYNEAMQKYYRFEMKHKTPADMAQDFIKADVKAFLMGWDAETASGLPKLKNDMLADIVKKFPDAFLGGFAGVDPWKGEMAVAEIERASKKLGLIGVKFQAAVQGFFPNDQRFYPLWEECQKLGLPILFHGGMAAAGAGTPGGMGTKLKYSQPIALDDVAADFPELKIISAHPTWPWTAESLAICRHKSNYYIDLSGWAPKYFPAELVHNVNTLLQDKVMFGSDWPAIGVERWLEEFQQLNIKPEVRQKVLLENAKKFLGLTLDGKG